jgi:hypothetical protein
VTFIGRVAGIAVEIYRILRACAGAGYVNGHVTRFSDFMSDFMFDFVLVRVEIRLLVL